MDKIPNSAFRTVRGYQLNNQKEGQLTPAMEDYLEMAYRLCLEDQYARVGKLSKLLHVKPSSASKMILKLVQLGYLAYDRYDSILLTKRGRETGAYLLARHDTLEKFLKLIGNANSLREVELIEHSLSAFTISQIKTLLEFFELNSEIQKQFEDYMKMPQVEMSAPQP